MSEDGTKRRSPLRLGTKVTLCVALVQIPLLAVAAMLHTREVRHEYLETVELRSRALSQSLQKRAADLSGYAPEMQRTLGLDIDCQALLKENEGDLVHVGVIGVDGRVIAHTDKRLWDQFEHREELEESAGGLVAVTVLGSEAYHTIIPVTVAPDTPPAAVIDIGFSREVIDRKIRDTFVYAASSFLAFVVLSFLLISGLLKRFVTNPIAKLSKAAAALAGGQDAADIPTGGSDEVGLLADSFNRMRDAIRRQITDLNREISNREEAQRLLSQSEEDLRVTLNSIGDAVIATDTDGRITRMNPVAEKLTGWDAREAVGQPLDKVFAIINAASREPVENPVKQVLASGEIVGLANHTILMDRNGVERQIADSGAPIKNDSGEVIGVVLVFRDVTDEYALQERLRQLQKMEAVGQLAGGVAHDFNNLLTGILGNAQLLEMTLDSSTKEAEFAQQIDKAANRAADLTGQLLAFSRKGKLQTVPVDTHEIIDEVVDMLSRSIDKRIEIKKLPNADPSVILGDPTQLQNALLNLGVNARDAMSGGGGVLTFATRNVTLDAEYCSRHFDEISPGDYLQIDVTDTGVGMSAETQKRIFEPFYTTKAKGAGTGLGLASVYGCLQSHHGVIRVYSEPDVGTTFKLFLPVSESCAPEPDGEQPAPAQRGHGRVLVVDDEEIIRNFAAHALESLGYDVSTCADGLEAVEFFREHHDEIGIVILDLIMPRLGGDQAFKQFKEIQPDVRVLIASGFTQNRVSTQMLENGALAFINKPFRIDELSKLVAQHMPDGA